MTDGEFLAWAAFHRQWPLDDHNRIYRPAAVIAASMGGGYQEKLDFMSPQPRKRVRKASVVRKP